MGSTERRTKDSAEQQSWELWLLLASHLLDQVHLKTNIIRILQFPGLKRLKAMILGGELTLFCAGQASVGS